MYQMTCTEKDFRKECFNLFGQLQGDDAVPAQSISTYELAKECAILCYTHQIKFGFLSKYLSAVKLHGSNNVVFSDGKIHRTIITDS